VKVSTHLRWSLSPSGPNSLRQHTPGRFPGDGWLLSSMRWVGCPVVFHPAGLMEQLEEPRLNIYQFPH
jgi:hypothetical protein